MCFWCLRQHSTRNNIRDALMCFSAPICHVGTLSPGSKHPTSYRVWSNYNMKGEGETWNICKGMEQLLPCYACSSTRAPIMSNIFPKDIPLCAYVQILFEKGNLMVIVMNVDSTDQKSRRKEMREILREGRGLFRCLGFIRRNDLGETWLFFPLCFSPVHRGVVCYKKAGRSLDTHH